MTGRLRERLVASAYTLGWAVVRRLPVPLAQALSRLAADVAWWRRGRGVCQLEANLRRVLGEEATEKRLHALARAGLRSYCRYWLEVFRLPAMSREGILARFRLRGGEVLWQALGSGRGVILALPHSGNWDHAGAWIVLSGYPFTTVAERLRPASLYDRFVAFRQELGMEVLPFGDGDGDGDVYAALADRLRAGRLVCLLADRDLTASGVEVAFFGEPARMPAGPAALALHTGAALLPVTLWYEPGRWGGRIHEEIRIPGEGQSAERIHAMTQQLAAAFETGIRQHPQDWHMLQPLWTADLDAARPTAPLAGAAQGRAAAPRQSRGSRG